MDALTYNVLHVIGVILLVAFTFQAFAAPERGRRMTMMLTGILALVVAVAGFGLLAKSPHIEGFPVWLIVKVVCWLLLSLLAGFAYRKPGMTGMLKVAAIALVAVAVYMVYMKPVL